jgi:NADH-quinone oxidoreductase subunit E
VATATENKIDRILANYSDEKGMLIQVLLDVQHEYHWLPPEVLTRISERLKIPRSYVIRVGSFYKAMSLTPVGRHLVQVCLGTACHVRGGAKILDNVELTLGIKAGETTKDMKYTLKRVNCLGCCALGPVMVIDSEAHAKVAPGKVKEILNQYN